VGNGGIGSGFLAPGSVMLGNGGSQVLVATQVGGSANYPSILQHNGTSNSYVPLSIRKLNDVSTTVPTAG